MISQHTHNAALHHLDRYELESYCATSSRYASDAEQSLRDAAVKVVLEGMQAGDRERLGRRKFRKQCAAQVRQEVGFSINTWFLIARLLMEIIPILWKWWRDRQADYENRYGPY